jgi:NADPH-dependent 2,4-dienoyl-CoA reductase/sulfur reductase-like enzyme
MHATRTMKCAVNPTIGREYECSFPARPTERKKVLVVGGGPAGMQAAITAAQRGHEVMLCEKAGSLGGALKYAAGVSFKEDLERFKEYLIRQVDSLPIRVLLNTEVTPQLVAQEGPDVLIAAVGGEPILPQISGVDKNSVVLAAQAYSEKTKTGDRVAVIGGGLVGCEIGLHLAQQGKDVVIIEMLDDVALDANIMHRRALMLELRKSLKIRTGLECVEITDEGVIAVDGNGKRVAFACDTVVLAVGYRARSDVTDALRDTAPEFMAVGDCVRPRKVLHAVRMGYDAAMAV